MSHAFIRPLAALGLLVGGAGSAHAAPQVVRHGAEGPSPILTGVTVPAGAETLYLSGQVPPVADKAADPATPAAYGDTRTQTVGIFRKIEALLAAQGYGLKDVVKLTVFLVGDPKLGGKQDFKGFSEGYAQFFGTAAQPNKVARSTVQVAALANPGFLVEIEAVAVKAK
ncbi:RidA family protein [Sphingobium chlorophenolicum]|uniref:Endoribonuclease L-PSP n=1 Tax=Sphingobium chlorophenolicum TaxID=46429 RepID=A0A081R8B2_SPHCR|nr:RidA family protein [Sphingobium chlorophenolicum]KEQ51435.1 Endoribonuclease L-PSP precursor [Sphingobium chlorophenolicum]